MLFIVGIRVYLMIWLHTRHILISVIAEEKKGDSVTEVKSCLKMKTSMTGDSCFLNIWDRNGTSIYSSEGNDYNEECYDSEQCYSVGMGKDGDDGGKCSVDVTINEETVEQGFIKDKYFRIGDCSNTSCEGKTEMFPRPFYGKNLDYYRKIAGESETRWDYINPGESTDGNLVFGESESICFNMTQCNILQSRKGDFSYYYLLEGGNVVESGELDDFATFGDCSTICNDLVIFIDATHGGGGFNYSFSEDDQIIEKYIEEGHVNSLCINTNTCTTISGNGNATYKILHNGQLEKSVNHSDYYMFGKCTCGYKPLFLIDSTKGEDIFRLLSSIWGMEVFIDVTSPQYMTACWLVKYDQQNLNATAANIIQRYVMGLLFYATDGWNWYSYYGFMSSKHECSWTDDTQIHQRKGVLCSTEKILKGIGIESNNLIGMLVSEIYTLAQVSNLADLEVIWLANNQLSGTLPVSMREFAFKYFDLDGNELQGSLPEDLFSLKGSFKINANQFTGTLPSININRDIELTELQISNNKISGTIPSGIGRASHLTVLNLSFNNITGKIPASITKLSKLSNLYLNSNELSGTLPSHIFTLIKLEVINFSYNRLSGIIPTEFGLGNILYDLDLDYNLLSGSIPSELSTELTKLKHLFLSNNILNGNITLNMPNLTTQLDTLYIENNQITGHIQECHETMIRADCYTPRDIVCECCQCFGIFNTPTAYVKEFPECASTELKIIFHNTMNELVGFDLFNEGNEYILHDLKTADSEDTKYTTCISTTDCYVLTNHFPPSYDLIIDNTTIFTSDDDLTNFGFSGTDTLALKNCKNYSICDITLIPGTEERSSFNRLFISIHNLNDFEDTSSFQYQTLCWWLKDMQLTGLRDSDVIIQRYLLALLHYHTNGEQWNQNTNWLSQESACNWYGIECNKGLTLISKIDLTDNGLDGFIPTELGELKGLEHLILSSNKLTGTLPQEITKLEYLKVLNVSKNSLRGKLPSHIQYLTDLKELDLNSNTFTSTLPPRIGYLKNIQSINLSNNSYSGELCVLSNFSKLEILIVSNNLFQGNITTVKELSNITHLDLSRNYFTGSPPIFGATHDKLEILHANGNIFSGSIPTIVGEMSNLKELILHNNKLWGTLPPQIGSLENITNITISYNKIKGTIPKEIGSLHQLKLLHLHSNLLEGTADHFIDNHNIDSFITDCGNTATEESLVNCKNCTECCNEENECISEIKTWPRSTLKKWKKSYDIPSANWVFILMLISWLSMIFLARALFIFKYKLPKSSYVYYEKRFQQGSVYRFFLGSIKIGWFVACLTVGFQLWIMYTFFQAGDRTSDINEWVFSVSCPSNSIECNNQRQDNELGWLTFAVILLLFVIPDIFDGLYLFYESCTHQKRLDIKGVIFGVMLTSVPVMSIVASVIYLYATSISNAALLKDSIVILFLSEIDEKVFMVVIRFNPSWNENIEKNIADYHSKMLIINAVDDSVFSEVEDIERQDDANAASNSSKVERMDLVDKNNCNDLTSESIASEDRVGISKCPEPEEILYKTSIDDQNGTLILEVKALTSQIQKMEHTRNIENLLILEMWSVLSKENVQFVDSASLKKTGIDVSALKGTVDSSLPETSHEVKKGTQGVRVNEETNSSLNFRQARVQELDTKIRDHYKHLYSSRSSLDILKSDVVDEASSAFYTTNDLDQEKDSSSRNVMKESTPDSIKNSSESKLSPKYSSNFLNTKTAPSACDENVEFYSSRRSSLDIFESNVVDEASSTFSTTNDLDQEKDSSSRNVMKESTPDSIKNSSESKLSPKYSSNFLNTKTAPSACDENVEFYSSRRSSLDIFESNVVDEASSTFSTTNDLDQEKDSSFLFSEKQITQQEFKVLDDYSKNKNKYDTEKGCFITDNINYAKIKDSSSQIVMEPDDTINATTTDVSNVILRPQGVIFDSVLKMNPDLLLLCDDDNDVVETS